MEEFVRSIKKARDFKGRSDRKEFFMFMLMSIVIMIGLIIIDAIMALQIMGEYGLLSTLFALFLFTPALSVSVRRLHDTGRSGRLALLYLVPIVGWIAIVLLAAIPGDLGSNPYGKDPNHRNYIFSPVKN